MKSGLLAHALVLIIVCGVARGEPCTVLGDYVGSEDITIWHDGFAFVTSGYKSNGTILAMTLESGAPKLHELEIVDMPTSPYSFRPWGMYLDNRTQQIFAVSHGDELSKEQTIAVLAIEDGAESMMPRLRFKFALTSPRVPYYGNDVYWFLNDLVVARRTDGTDEIFVTQFGPLNGDYKEFHLWRCTFAADGVPTDGRLPMECEPAVTAPSGFNGVTISGDGRRLWLNQLWEKRIWAVHRDPASGALSRMEAEDFSLANFADNLEWDDASGSLFVGDVGGVTMEPFKYHFDGGQLTLHPDGEAKQKLGFRQPASAALGDYVVSSAVPLSHDWLIVGSPYNKGLAVCKIEEGGISKEEL